MGLVPKTMSVFCIGYIKKEDFWCVSEIGTELALYKDRCQVRYQWLYLADMNQEDDENAEKLSATGPNACWRRKRSCQPHGFRQPVPLLPRSWQRPDLTY